MITQLILRIIRVVSPPIKSLDFRGFDSSRLLILRCGNSYDMKFIGGLPESLPQGPLIGKLLIGGLGVIKLCVIYIHIICICLCIYVYIYIYI